MTKSMFLSTACNSEKISRHVSRRQPISAAVGTSRNRKLNLLQDPPATNCKALYLAEEKQTSCLLLHMSIRHKQILKRNKICTGRPFN